jgi:hypothetical protein
MGLRCGRQRDLERITCSTAFKRLRVFTQPGLAYVPVIICDVRFWKVKQTLAARSDLPNITLNWLAPLCKSSTLFLSGGYLLYVVSMQGDGRSRSIKQNSNAAILLTATDDHARLLCNTRATGCAEFTHSDPHPCHERRALRDGRLRAVNGPWHHDGRHRSASPDASCSHAKRWKDER